MTMSGMWNGQSEFSYSNTVFCVRGVHVDLVDTAQKLHEEEHCLSFSGLYLTRPHRHRDQYAQTEKELLAIVFACERFYDSVGLM